MPEEKLEVLFPEEVNQRVADGWRFVKCYWEKTGIPMAVMPPDDGELYPSYAHAIKQLLEWTSCNSAGYTANPDALVVQGVQQYSGNNHIACGYLIHWVKRGA